MKSVWILFAETSEVLTMYLCFVSESEFRYAEMAKTLELLQEKYENVSAQVSNFHAFSLKVFYNNLKVKNIFFKKTYYFVLYTSKNQSTRW